MRSGGVGGHVAEKKTRSFKLLFERDVQLAGVSYINSMLAKDVGESAGLLVSSRAEGFIPVEELAELATLYQKRQKLCEDVDYLAGKQGSRGC